MGSAVGRRTSLNAYPVGQRETLAEYAESFGLLAELAIAVAGFAGVSAAFAGRDRSFQAFERTRLLALFINSGAILSGCGVVHTLLLTGAAPETAFRLASLATVLVLIGLSVPQMFRVYRAARNPDSTAERWAINLTVGYLLLSFLLLLANAMLGTSYLLVGTLWLLLVYGLWMFWRLLTRAN